MRGAVRGGLGLGWVALAAACLVAGPPAWAGDMKPRLTRLSGASPFPHGCGVPGEPTEGAEAEPHLAVDPHDSRHLVAVWQQDRFAVYGGTLSNVVAVSHDGGKQWRRAFVKGLSQCTDGEPERTSDPWLSFDRKGRLYLASLTFDLDLAGQVSQIAGEELAGATALLRPLR